MFSLLISLLVFALVAGLIWWVIGLFVLPDPIGKIVRVIFVVFCVLILIFEFLLPMVGGAGTGVGHGFYFR